MSTSSLRPGAGLFLILTTIFTGGFGVPRASAATFDDLLPQSGIQWSTSAQSAFTVEIDPSFSSQPFAQIVIPDFGPGGWLEARIPGPGTLTFKIDQSISLTPFHLFVDEMPMRGVLTSDGYSRGFENYPGYPGHPSRYTLSLPAGEHTVRWELPSGRNYLLGSMQVRIGFLAWIAGRNPAAAVLPAGCPQFYQPDNAPQVIQEDGITFLRVMNAGVNLNDSGDAHALSTVLRGPGMLTFRSRTTSATGQLVQNQSNVEVTGIANLASRDYNYWEHYSAGIEPWQKQQLFIPKGECPLRWWVAPGGVRLDLAEFSFAPCTEAPVNEVLGLADRTVSFDPTSPWTGCKSSDGFPFAACPESSYGYSTNSLNPQWLEFTVNGPAALYWTELGYATPRLMLDGQRLDNYSAYLGSSGSSGADPLRWMDAGQFLPAGAHVLRFELLHYRPGIRAGLAKIRILPLPAAYFAWRPPYRGTPVTNPVWPTTDWDLDGLLNFEEYGWQTDPFQSSVPPQPVLEFEGGLLTATLPAPRPESDGVRLIFERSADLSAWQGTPVESISGAPPGHAKFRFPREAAPRAFYRPRIEFLAP